jgi:RNase P subunit RPR2
MGASHKNTPGAKLQRQLDERIDDLRRWFMDDGLSATTISEKFASTIQPTPSSGQVGYALHRHGLKRPRNAHSKKHKAAIKCRTLKRRSCPHCKEMFKPDGNMQIYCKVCAPTHRFTKYIRQYGLDKQNYDRLITEQKNCCEICNDPLVPGDTVVDHDHKTGNYRALLCRICNLKLSAIEDESFRHAAIRYLECHKNQIDL